jgi:predicted phage terminase large subunit-like protein
MSVDTAAKTAEHNDYSACTVWRVVEGRFYLEHVWRRRVDYPTLKRTIIELADIFKPDTMLIEDKVTGTGLIQELRVEDPSLPVIAYEPKGDKETRLRLQAAKIEAGLVYLPREGGEWLTDFEEEVRQFPGGAHDDMVDSMSQMLDFKSTRRTGDLIVRSYRTLR